MKKDGRSFPALVFLFALAFSCPALFASGNKEEAAKEPENINWTLCITSFDVSALPPRRQITGDTVTRLLADTLGRLEFRFRGEEEAAYYRAYALSKSRAASAKALAAKRNERDLLLYKGEPQWRYRKNLKTIDEAIVKLEEELAAAGDALAPVEEKPALLLAAENLGGTYPAAPVSGGEYRFCVEKKADAFLAGNLSEYHGRVYLEVKLYTVYTRSWSFEDSVLFSPEDLASAMDELSGRLAAAVSDSVPSAVLVRASPPETVVSVDGVFAGRGETEPLVRSPGETEIELSAGDYAPLSIPLELNPGELAEVSARLTPLRFSGLEADVSGSPGSRVYLGGLYAGETPYTLRLPGTDFAYISVETPGGETGSVVYRDNDIVRGRAEFTRTGDFSGRADFLTSVPVSPEEKRVDRARRGFYGAYGTFWVALPIALISAGIAGTYISANNYAAGSQDQAAFAQVHDNAVIGQYVRGAAYGAIGVSLGITFFQIFRYLYVSGEDAAPLVKYKSADTEGEP